MSIIDIREEWVSDVDVNAEFNINGLSVSIYLDQHELTQHVNYFDIAHAMLSDDIKYDDELIMEIIYGLENTVNTLRGGLGAREQ
jgi:uncharacterized protein YacL (UPF0231 family)